MEGIVCFLLAESRVEELEVLLVGSSSHGCEWENENIAVYAQLSIKIDRCADERFEVSKITIAPELWQIQHAVGDSDIAIMRVVEDV